MRDPEQMYTALRSLGFDEVFDVAKGADVVTEAVKMKLKEPGEKPLISSACPANYEADSGSFSRTSG